MKCSCSSYVNKRLPCPFCLSFFFSFVGFFEQWTPTYIYIYIYIFFFFFFEQCCLFEFPNLAIILKCSHASLISFLTWWLTHCLLSLRFLMMPVFKGDSPHLPTTFSLSNTNTSSILLSSPCFLFQAPSSVPFSSPCSLFQAPSSIYSDQPLHHDASENSKLFPP